MPPYRPLAERFWEKCEPEPNSNCWLWIGARNADGYGLIGRFRQRGSSLAHRVSYELHGGTPGELRVLHRCDTPPCVNPTHLFLGTQRDNVWDSVQKGRARGGRLVGERNGRAKLTMAAIEELRAYRVQGESYERLALRVGVCRTQARQAILGLSYRREETVPCS